MQAAGKGEVIDQETRERFRQFTADEEPAIGQLRQLAGGELREALDGTIDSLVLLDRFIRNVTKDPDWSSSALFAAYPTTNIRNWLAVRVAYYLAACLRQGFGGEWRLSDQEKSPFYRTPVYRVRGREISPLEIGYSMVDGILGGGLAGVAAALQREVD
jgi:hypothetical protein